MKPRSKVCLFILTGAVLLSAIACSRRAQQTSAETSSQAPNAQAQAPSAQNPSATPSPAPQKPGTPPPVSTAQAGGSAVPTQTGEPAQVAQTPAPKPPPPKPKTFKVPAGSRINVRTVTSMSTKTLKTGDPFQASLSAPLVVQGVVIAPKGADVTGVAANSDPGGRVKGVASLSLQLQAIRSADGQTMRVHTNSFVQQAKGTKKRDAMRTGIAAGAGAAIGAIAGGGKGAAIGAGVGGGAGVATNMATRGAAAELPAESILEFTLADSSVITEIQPGSLTKKRSAASVDPAAANE